MIKLIKNLSKRDWIFIFISIGLIVVQVWLDLKMPDYMSEVTKLVQTEGSKIEEIIVQGIYMLLCALGSLLAAIVVGYLISNIGASFSMRTRKKLFNKVESLGMEEIKLFKTSSLITRTTNDITNIEMFVIMGLQLLIKSPITVIWAVTKILNKSWQWSALTAGIIAILLIFIGIMIMLVIPKFKIIQKLIDKLNEVTRENLTGIRVVRAFNAEEYQEKKFEVVNNDLTKLQMFTQRMMSIMQPLMFLLMYFLTLFIYVIGANLIKDALMVDRLNIFGDMIVFSSYAIQVIMSFLMLAFVFIFLPRAQVSAKRINEVFNTHSKIIDGKIDKSVTKEKGTIEFKNVSFKYPDAEEYLLKNISFKINKGETVAFIGSTGSGKSTLINLIPRFYDATDGEVIVDGLNVKEYNSKFLYNKLGYVTQKAVIFNGSVSYNVNYGDNGKKGKKAIKEAIKIAQAEDFVLKMEDKYDYHLAANGTNLSGGQKQRISIARAIARNPEIYIFDDSFSALDYKTDSILRKELKKYTKESTNLIVATRIGTIMDADKIIVLDKGECVGIGTHKELLNSCKVYKEIALSQLSKEELENE
ncbi:MAG: ABC transporter ATP-binding protein [Bacilli bacterium]|nr:ABC transporter ATP-binding protein [Bacilli bacterium]